MDENEKMKKIEIEEETFTKAPDTAAPETETPAADTAEKAKKKCKSDGEGKKLKAKIEALEKELSAEKAKVAESEDKYLRLAAEYDNFRKRSRAERDGIYADAAADAVKQLLPVIDNLERATAYTAPDKVAQGVQMILSSLPAVFEKMNIEAFGEAGVQFDPNMHNAVMHEENEELGENVITDVLQKGYKLGDKIIRYAMVKVAN